MRTTTNTSWRTSPFIVGATYRVRHDFQAHRGVFHAGEILTYEDDAYSIYDSCTGYFFSLPDAPNGCVWDVYDDEDPTIWPDLFELVAPPANENL